jgi:iron complex outermembrane recepter protein
MKTLNVTSLFASAAFIALAPQIALAQPAQPQPSPAGKAAEAAEEVIVTATSAVRSRFNTPLSVSALDATDLERVSASSQADILATVPGLKAEGGGGEVASNVQVRGMPSSGQFQFTPLQYDGIPVLRHSASIRQPLTSTRAMIWEFSGWNM